MGPLGVLVSQSGIFDLARGWFGMFVFLPSGRSLISCTYKFYPLSRENPSYRVRGIPAAESGSLVLPSGGNPINGAVNSKL